MWIPTHSRPDRASSSGVAIYALLLGALLTGCASAPKFGSDNAVVRKTPIGLSPPVFDESAPFSRIASTEPVMGLIAAPEPFAWKTLSNSAGGRKIEGITVGQGGYRTFVLGSLAGDDPLAIELTEKLARHIQENQIVLGGIQASVIRNPNPDGAAGFRMENENGVYLNRQFAASFNPKTDLQKQEPEIRFLLGVLDDKRPQRVIHIRTVKHEQGRIAASQGSATVAKDVCSWLNFGFVELPGNSADGTLERYLSTRNTCEILTFAIPQTSDKTTLWEDYGDSLLNLLLAEDFETRKLAREQKGAVAADRRGKKYRLPKNGNE
jgi:hypothetical protein